MVHRRQHPSSSLEVLGGPGALEVCTLAVRCRAYVQAWHLAPRAYLVLRGARHGMHVALAGSGSRTAQNIRP